MPYEVNFEVDCGQSIKIAYFKFGGAEIPYHLRNHPKDPLEIDLKIGSKSILTLNLICLVTDFQPQQYSSVY